MSSYNSFCYADDVLLCSTTVSGLQELINIATRYVNQFGLWFNPAKTTCMVLGKNPFTSLPQWHIDNVKLNIEPTITYLGSVLGNFSRKSHCDLRTRAANSSFYALQGSGIKFPGVSPSVSTKCLDRLQSKFIKKCVGVG